MPLDRILEPEVMDSPDEATDYDSMDHREVNRRFVDDLLERVQGSGFRVQDGGEPSPLPGTQYSVPSTVPSPLPEPRTLNPEPSPEPPLLDVVDLGTGTAQIPIELCRRYAHCRVMAADAAVSMLEIARYNIEIASLIERIELVRVDAKELPFDHQMFDVVMSNSIIHHIPEPIHVLREAARIVRQGGLLFFRDLLRPDSATELAHLVQTYAGQANEHQQRMFAESLHAALSLSEIRSLVSSLGFAAESVQQTSDRHWTWAAEKG